MSSQRYDTRGPKVSCCPTLANCNLLAIAPEDVQKDGGDKRCDLPKLPGDSVATTKLENSFVHPPTLTLDNLLVLRDVPVCVREKFAKNHCKDSKLLKTLLSELKSQQSQPKYDLFFDIKPIFMEGVRLASGDSEEDLRLAALVLLRLTTFSRSADIETMLPGIIRAQDSFLIRLSSKGNKSRTLAVTGWTLFALLNYLSHVMLTPCEAFFRTLECHSRPLTSERLAKLVLLLMNRLGLDTDLFKAHSLRGAAASFALGMGASPQFVRQRGAWRSDVVFDEHYGRGHQLLNWDKLFLGPEGDPMEICNYAEVLNPSPVQFCSFSTKEEIRKK